MKGPFLLPDSINEGDFIELESMGAYSVTMKNNFNGFLVKPKDSESLAKSIERLIFDERLMKKFGANSRKLVQQRFSADIVFKNFLGVYREVLKKDP